MSVTMLSEAVVLARGDSTSMRWTCVTLHSLSTLDRALEQAMDDGLTLLCCDLPNYKDDLRGLYLRN